MTRRSSRRYPSSDLSQSTTLVGLRYKLSTFLLEENGYGSAQGQTMNDQIVEPFPGREKCNFCSERPTTQLYACKNFLIPRTKTALFQHESVGAWAAPRVPLVLN